MPWEVYILLEFLRLCLWIPPGHPLPATPPEAAPPAGPLSGLLLLLGLLTGVPLAAECYQVVQTGQKVHSDLILILCFISDLVFCFVLFQIFHSYSRMVASCVMLLRWQSREHSHLVVNTPAFIEATLQASERILGFGVQSGSEASPSLLKMIVIIQWRTGAYK